MMESKELKGSPDESFNLLSPAEGKEIDQKMNGTSSFVKKLFSMVNQESDEVIEWIRDGTAFYFKDIDLLCKVYLPKYFRHSRFPSLIRQLNFYSFYKIQDGNKVMYQHSYFRKDRPDLLKYIKRRGSGKPKDPFMETSSDPVVKHHRVAVTISSPLSKIHHLNTMSPVHKPGIPSETPQITVLDHGKDSLKRALQINGFCEIVDESKRPKVDLEPIIEDIDIKFFLNEDCSNIGGPEFSSTNKESILKSSGSKKSYTSDSYMDYVNSIQSKDEQVYIAEKMKINISGFGSPKLNEESLALWEQPLSPLSLDQSANWLDLSF